MTSDKSQAAAYREKILEEHRQIAELTSSIAQAGDLRDMVAGLQQLEPLLECHFDREESQDGLHANIRDRAPRYDAAVKRLVEDHRALLAKVRELRDRIGPSATPAGPVIPEIRESARSLLLDLADHEARENEVFLDTWTDLGTGD